MQARDEAEALAIALELGLATVADVVAWADGWLARETQPHWVWSELALGASDPCDKVLGLLKEIPGALDESNARGLLLRRMHSRLTRATPRGREVAHALFQLAASDALDDPKVIALGRWADDELDLVRDGIKQGTAEEVVQEMRRVLEEAIERRAGPATGWTFEPG